MYERRKMSANDSEPSLCELAARNALPFGQWTPGPQHIATAVTMLQRRVRLAATCERGAGDRNAVGWSVEANEGMVGSRDEDGTGRRR